MEIRALLYCIMAALLVFAAVSDWKTTYISGLLGILMWAITFSVGYVNGSEVSLVFSFIAFILYSFPKEIPMFGSADFIPCAFYACYYLRSADFIYRNLLFVMSPLVLLLIVLYPSAVLYCKYKENKKYKLFSNQCIPALPAFAAVHLLSGFVNVFTGWI